MHKLKNIVFHHIGYACSDSKNVIETFFPLLTEKDPIFKFKDIAQGVTATFFNLSNGSLIEFIEPLKKGSPIDNFLKYNVDGSLHHLAWEAKNFEKSLDEMNSNCFRQITRVEQGFEGRQVVFFLPRNGLRNPLIEIVSRTDIY